MSRLVLFLILAIGIAFGEELDISSEDFNADYLSGGKLVLSDWDSTLYGKPICVPIPSNMSLCSNINYKQMKMPNVLGHDTLDEVHYQSSAWIPLLSINCHKDTQLFLCSLFAPVCVEQAAIYPCRSLCETVKRSCEGQMMSYNYPWPSMFNCSNFPEDNGLCIQPTSQMATSTTPKIMPTPNKIEKTSTKLATTQANVIKQDLTNETEIQSNNCISCDETNVGLEEIVINYCNSDIALRGRVQSIKSSRFDLVNPKLKKLTKIKLNNKTMSSFIVIPRRDRKIVKGARLLSPSIIDSYLNDRSLLKYTRQLDIDEEYQTGKEIEMYLLSNYHLKLVPNDGKSVRSINFESRHDVLSSKQLKKKNSSLKTGYWNNKRSASINAKFCRCEKIRKNLRRPNMKYLIMANVLKIRKSLVKLSENDRIFKRDNHDNDTIYIDGFNSTNLSMIKRDVKNHSKKWANESNRKFKVLFVTSIVQWNRAREFIDYLEDDTVDKSEMCTNVKNTIDEINRAQSFLLK